MQKFNALVLCGLLLVLFCGQFCLAQLTSTEPQNSTAQISIENFTQCLCKALRPGSDNQQRQKACSYSCQCTDSKFAKNISLVSPQLPTSAVSFDDWDRGSQICHGQYAFRPNLSSPPWTTQVRFTSFWISASGETQHPEKIEVASNIFQYLSFSKKAPEIADWLKASLETKTESKPSEK